MAGPGVPSHQRRSRACNLLGPSDNSKATTTTIGPKPLQGRAWPLGKPERFKIGWQHHESKAVPPCTHKWKYTRRGLAGSYRAMGGSGQMQSDAGRGSSRPDRAGKNLAGGGAARAKARDAQPPVTAGQWARGSGLTGQGIDSSCRCCDYPGGIACKKLHTVHLAQCPEAHRTIASTINFARRPSRSLSFVRRLFRGLRCARLCRACFAPG